MRLALKTSESVTNPDIPLLVLSSIHLRGSSSLLDLRELRHIVDFKQVIGVAVNAAIDHIYLSHLVYMDCASGYFCQDFSTLETLEFMPLPELFEVHALDSISQSQRYLVLNSSAILLASVSSRVNPPRPPSLIQLLPIIGHPGQYVKVALEGGRHAVFHLLEDDRETSRFQQVVKLNGRGLGGNIHYAAIQVYAIVCHLKPPCELGI